MISLKINGSQHDLDVAADMPLLWAIRDVLNMTGTKYGCGIAQCGACTVHLDGQPVRSCQTQVGDAAGHEITTIEGVNGKVAKAVQAAWQELDVVHAWHVPALAAAPVHPALAEFAALEAGGYAGWVGLEYKPSAASVDSFEWLARERRALPS